MSCCNYFDSNEFINSRNIILTKNDRQQIRDGACLVFHFHGRQFRNNTITFFVTLWGKTPPKDSDIVKKYLKNGAVAPFPVTQEQLEHIEKTDDCAQKSLLSDPPFKISVVTSETYSKRVIEEYKEE